jgi:hypothetical protein
MGAALAQGIGQGMDALSNVAQTGFNMYSGIEGLKLSRRAQAMNEKNSKFKRLMDLVAMGRAQMQGDATQSRQVAMRNAGTL